MTNLEFALERATDVLGDEEKAREWLDHMSATLGAKPIDLIETDNGLERVLVHLSTIERHSVRDL